MFKGFNLKTTESLEWILKNNNSYTEILEKNKNTVFKSIEDHIRNDKFLDGQSIMSDWFPENKNIHVFISHSHKDIKLAENLANWLYENFQITSFLDSHIWNYSNDLLKILDDKYAKDAFSSSYIYEVRNETTSHVHMMLSSALNQMIDNCEALFFLNTDNAIENNILSSNTNEDRTASPWIMSELLTSSLIESKQNIKRKTFITESIVAGESRDLEKCAKLNISYPVKMQHLINLDLSDLSAFSSEAKNHRGYNALTVLYNSFADCRFDTSKSLESMY